MMYGRWEHRLVLLTAVLLVLSSGSPTVSDGSFYNAAADFSISANPNGQWTYLYDTGSGPQLLTNPRANIGAGLDDWWNGHRECQSTSDHVEPIPVVHDISRFLSFRRDGQRSEACASAHWSPHQ